MSAYVDNIEERIKKENPLAWLKIKEIEGHFKRHGIDLWDSIILDASMTEEEEKMAIIEYKLKKGKKLEDAILEAEMCYKEIKELDKEMERAEKMAMNTKKG